MSPPSRLPGPRPGRLLGLYALSVMERDGPVYGYSLAERVSDQTDGAWRPGAGAVYPALQTLVSRGWARAAVDGRRRVYAITPQGRASLDRIRREWIARRRTGPDLGMIWSEIVGGGDPGQHLLGHLHHHLEGIATYLERDPLMRAGGSLLRDQVLRELDATRARLDALRTPARPSRRPRPGRRP
jgi:DNA-binding PadR family transcriptional regulator